MAEIRPFFGLKYNKEKIGDISKVITQPYDKITPQMQAEYYEKSPYNFVRLIFGREKDRYEESAKYFKKWWEERVILKDKKPAIYPYTQEFKINEVWKVRKGFVAVLKLSNFEEGIVLPHERTHSAPKEDRYKLFKRTEKDYEQVFMLYPDKDSLINSILEKTINEPPEIEANDEYGVIHKLWTLTDYQTIRRIKEIMQPNPVLIADGHHRYETSLRIRDEFKKEVKEYEEKCFNYRMVTLVNLYDPALVILPTHRGIKKLKIKFETLIEKLKKYFMITKVLKEELEEKVKKGGLHVFGLYKDKTQCYCIALKDISALKEKMPERSQEYRELDVAILHALVIEEILGIGKDEVEAFIGYERYIEDLLEKVGRGEYELGLILNPATPEQVQKIASKQERMPPKSTDFYPKLVSGLVWFDIAKKEKIPEV